MGLYKIPKIIGIDRKPSFGARINWHHPLSHGLIGAWLFNEGGGNKVYGYSPFWNGTFNGALSWGGLGKYYGLYHPGGGTTRVDFPNTTAYSNFTMAARIMPVTGIAAYGIVIGSSLNYHSIFIRSERIEVWTTTGKQIGTTSLVPLNVWTNIAVKVNGRYATAYENGKIDPIGVFDLGATWNVKFDYIGYDGSSGDNFKGYYDYLYFWDRLLTDGEISSLHEKPYQIYWNPMRDIYIIHEAAPPTGGKSIFGFDSIFHAGGIIQT